MRLLADTASSLLTAAFALMLFLGVACCPNSILADEPLDVISCPASCYDQWGDCYDTGHHCYFGNGQNCACDDGEDDEDECLCII